MRSSPWYCGIVVRYGETEKKQGRSEDALQVLDELKQVLIHFTAYINYICDSCVYIYIHICSILLYIEIHVDLILSPHVVMKSH